MIRTANGKYRIWMFVQNTPKRATRKYFLILLIWGANRRTECWNSQEYHYVDSFVWFNEWISAKRLKWYGTKQNKQNKSNRMLWNWFAWFILCLFSFDAMLFHLPLSICKIFSYTVYMFVIADRQCEQVRSIGLPVPWTVCALFLDFCVMLSIHCFMHISTIAECSITSFIK